MSETSAYKKALDTSYRLLAYRPRTEYELRSRLEKAGFVPEIVDYVISDLKEKRLLDDEDFARNWVTRRLSGKPVGAMYLRAELKQKGVDSQLIISALKDYDEESEFNAAMQLVHNKINGKSGEINWRRLAGFLSRRGFSSSVLSRVYRVLEEDGRFDIS